MEGGVCRLQKAEAAEEAEGEEGEEEKERASQKAGATQPPVGKSQTIPQRDEGVVVPQDQTLMYASWDRVRFQTGCHRFHPANNPTHPDIPAHLVPCHPPGAAVHSPWSAARPCAPATASQGRQTAWLRSSFQGLHRPPRPEAPRAAPSDVQVASAGTADERNHHDAHPQRSWAGTLHAAAVLCDRSSSQKTACLPVRSHPAVHCRQAGKQDPLPWSHHGGGCVQGRSWEPASLLRPRPQTNAGSAEGKA